MPHRAARHVWHACGIAVKLFVWHLSGMARDDQHFRLRIPEDLKARVETAARENHRSMTAEIIARLELTFSHGPMVDEELAQLVIEKLQVFSERLDELETKRSEES
jgi:hypothetical protein